MTEGRKASDVPLPGGNFRLFVTRLGYQALMSLGLIENPLTGAQEPNLSNARMLLDDLAMLLDKTEGNLDQDEREHLEKLLGDLRHALGRAESDGE